MTGSVTDQDVRKLVRLVGDGRRSDTERGMPACVLESLYALVASDELTFVELDPARSMTLLMQEVFDEHLQVQPTTHEGVDPFWLNYWDCRSCSYPSVTGDVRTITTLSDFYSRRQWHDTGMYADHLRGIEHRAMVCLSAPGGLSRRLLLFRRGGPDFGARDRLLLWLLRPHLDELYQELQRRRQPEPNLTSRQRQLVTLVSRGLSNAEIARELTISVATVRTHLENIFRQLDVASRSAAVAKTLPAPPY